MQKHPLTEAGRWLPINKNAVKVLGLNAVYFLSELINRKHLYKEKGQLDNGWFYATVESVEGETGLSLKVQNKAIEVLEQYGLVKKRLVGFPAVRFFYVPNNVVEAVKQLKPTVKPKGKNSGAQREELTFPKGISEVPKGNNSGAQREPNRELSKEELSNENNNNNRGDDRPRHAVVAAAPKVPNGADTKSVAEAYGKAYLADQVAVDAACMSRKITKEQFTEALRDFYAFKVAEGARWHSEGDFRKNFLNYLPGWKSRKSVGVAYSRPEDGGGYKRPN